MPLYDVESINNKLEAITDTGRAVSEPIEKINIEEDFRRVTGIRWKGYHQGKSGGHMPAPDCILEHTTYQDGEVMWIKYYEEPEMEKVVWDNAAFPVVTKTDIDLFGGLRNVLNYELDGYTYVGTDPIQLFCNHPADKNIGTTTVSGSGTSVRATFEFINPVTMKRIYSRSNGSYPTSGYDKFWDGSNDGTNWTAIVNVENVTDPNTPTEITDPALQGPWKYLRMRWYAHSSYGWRCSMDINCPVGDRSVYDISSIANGRTVEYYIYDKDIPTAEINGYIRPAVGLRTESDRRRTNYYYAVGEDLTIFPSRSLTTGINFKHAGDWVDEIYGVIYDTKFTNQPYMTDNTSPSNNVTVAGANAPLETNAYKPFRELSEEDSYSVAVPSDGVVDIQHIYQFDEPTSVYKFEMTTGPQAEAPRSYQVLGSHDGITYDTLIDITQEISVDNLTLLKTWDPSLYQRYTYYKVHVTAGTPDGIVSAKQYKLIIEDGARDDEVPVQ